MELLTRGTAEGVEFPLLAYVGISPAGTALHADDEGGPWEPAPGHVRVGEDVLETAALLTAHAEAAQAGCDLLVMHERARAAYEERARKQRRKAVEDLDRVIRGNE
jgi:hypothetical protein